MQETHWGKLSQSNPKGFWDGRQPGGPGERCQVWQSLRARPGDPDEVWSGAASLGSAD